MTRPAIAAVVITKNEEANLARCLSSVLGWASEIVVVDSGSTDRTREIAARFTDRVLVREWPGYGLQKQFAIEQATAPWVFSIDADEEASPELSREIAGLPLDVAGYLVPRQVHYLGRWIRYGVWNPDRVLRLFRKDCGRFTPDRVHETVVLEGPVGRLQSPLRHYSFRDLSHHLEKLNDVTTLAALQMHERGRHVGLTRLLLQPGWEFARSYLLHQGFRDGVPGLVVAKLHAYHCFLKYAKLWELGLAGRKDA